MRAVPAEAGRRVSSPALGIRLQLRAPVCGQTPGILEVSFWRGSSLQGKCPEGAASFWGAGQGWFGGHSIPPWHHWGYRRKTSAPAKPRVICLLPELCTHTGASEVLQSSSFPPLGKSWEAACDLMSMLLLKHLAGVPMQQERSHPAHRSAWPWKPAGSRTEGGVWGDHIWAATDM